MLLNYSVEAYFIYIKTHHTATAVCDVLENIFERKLTEI